ALLSALGTKRLPAEVPRRALEDGGEAEHDVVPLRVFYGSGVREVHKAFVGGHAAADGEDEDADDEHPEVEFAPMPEGVLEVGRLATLADAEQHQPAVARVNDGMNRLREHRGAAREEGGDELRRGDH